MTLSHYSQPVLVLLQRLAITLFQECSSATKFAPYSRYERFLGRRWADPIGVSESHATEAHHEDTGGEVRTASLRLPGWARTHYGNGWLLLLVS